MRFYKKLLMAIVLAIFLITNAFSFTGNSENYQMTTNIGLLGGSSNISTSPIIGSGYSENYFLRLGSATFNTSYLLQKPNLTFIYPLNNSNLNLNKRGINFYANFTKDISELILINNNKTFNLSRYISDKYINTSFPVNYGENILNFYLTDKYGIKNNQTLYLDINLSLPYQINDIDGDGISDSNDTIVGNLSNIFTSIPNLSLEIENSTNLTQVFNETKNISFKQNSKPLIEFEYDFQEASIDLTQLLVLNNTENNKSKLLISGINIGTNKTKSMYLDLSGNTSIFSSLCIKDAEIEDFSEISQNCNGENETFVQSIPSTVGQYSISFTNSSNTTVQITGLRNSGVAQMCTEQWSVGNWGACSSGTQTRIVTDVNSCGTQVMMPATTQSCSSGSSSSSGGGGSSGGSSSSSSSSGGGGYISSSSVSNKILQPEVQSIINFYDITISGSTEVKNSYTDKEEIVIANKGTNIDVVSFTHDFSQTDLNISTLEIVSSSTPENSFVIVKNLDLGNNTKTLRLRNLQNTNTVCIKDAQISSISEMTGDCTGLEEYLLSCNGQKTLGYSCSIENDLYVIDGLKHSAVKEVDSSLITQDQVTIISDTTNSNNTIEENDFTDEREETNVITKEDSSYTIYVIIVLVFILLIFVILYLISKKKPSLNNHPDYKKVDEYVKTYYTQYTKEQLKTALDNAQEDKKLSEYVLNMYYKK